MLKISPLSLVHRQLQPADLDQVLALPQQSQEVTQGFNWPAEKLQQELMQAKGWGAFLHRELVAFILYREAPKVYEISTLICSAKYRRQGVMTILFNTWVKNSEPDFSIWLEVHEQNIKARSLYKMLGFQEVGKRAHYYPDGGAAVLYNFR